MSGSCMRQGEERTPEGGRVGERRPEEREEPKQLWADQQPPCSDSSGGRGARAEEEGVEGTRCWPLHCS